MPKVSQQYLDERRAHILDAARRCFARDGFHQTSMQDLFAEAGLSAGAVYRYFPGKAAMIVAIARESMSDLVEMLHNAATADDERSLGDLIAELLETVEQRHRESGIGDIALTVWAEAVRDREIAIPLSSALGEVRSELVTLVRRRQEDGRVSSTLPPEAIAASLLTMVPGFIMQLSLHGPAAVAGVPDAVRMVWADAAIDSEIHG